MVKIKGWGFVRPQMTEYSIVGSTPTKLGDVTELRNAGHRIVRVGLKEDTKGNWWLVELRPDFAPIVRPSASGTERLQEMLVDLTGQTSHQLHCAERRLDRRITPAKRIKVRAALVQKILRLKAALRFAKRKKTKC